MKGLHIWFNGETGMIISWTISTDGRVLRDDNQGVLWQEERLTGNSSIVLVMSWGNDTRAVVSISISMCIGWSYEKRDSETQEPRTILEVGLSDKISDSGCSRGWCNSPCKTNPQLLKRTRAECPGKEVCRVWEGQTLRRRLDVD